MEQPSLPLAGIRLLDLTRARSGPTAVRHLADWGADVIKIEESAGGADGLGGPRDGSDFQSLQRNKRSMTLNLKEPEGKEIFFKLAKDADVIVENYRPDVKFRLGIDYESVRKVNPRIIYGSISGFGQEGPYRDRPGVDQIAQGMGGLMSITGMPGQGPVRVGIAISDISAGMTLAMGMILALYQREHTGVGQWVYTSLVEAQIQHLDFQAARWLIDHEVPEQMGNDHPTLMPTGVFPSADGYVNIAAAGNAIYVRLCEALGVPELVDHPDYKGSRDRSRNREALKAALGERTRRYKSVELVDILNKAGVPSGPIYSVDQSLNDPQVQMLHMSAGVEHPRHGHLELLGQAVSLSGAGGKPPIRLPAPDMGQHTDEVLAGLGYDATAIAGLRARGVL